MPGVTRDRAKRRVYTEHHIGWLTLHRHVDRANARLHKTCQQGSAAPNQRRELLRGHRTRVQETIARWHDALTLIEAKIEFYDEWVANGERPAVSPHRRMRSKKQTRA
jgi:DNA-binding transcriptional MerR regulator